MPVKTIYQTYVQTPETKTLKFDAYANQVLEMFRAECESMDVENPDEIEILIKKSQNPRLWAFIDKNKGKFESDTKLTVYKETRLMTLVKAAAEKTKDNAKPVDPAPKPEPAPSPTSEEPVNRSKSKKGSTKP